MLDEGLASLERGDMVEQEKAKAHLDALRAKSHEAL